MLLKDFNEWNKRKMKSLTESGTLNLLEQQNSIATTLDDMNKTSSIIQGTPEDSVLVVQINGKIKLYYSRFVVNQVDKMFCDRLEQEIAQKNYWRSRSEDKETAFNLQKSFVDKMDKQLTECAERISVLSDALTRSKFKERGKIIQITKLTNKPAKSQRKR